MYKIIIWFGLIWALPVQAMQITVTIPPLAVLVKPLLAEEDRLTILLKPGASPHGFQLRPSHLADMSRSDMVLTVGSGVDAWVKKPLSQMPKIPVVSMQKLPGLVVFPKRNLALDEGNEHDAHHHHDSEDAHEAVRQDGHLWLSMHNMRLMMEAVAKALIRLEPQQSGAIKARLREQLKAFEETDAALKQQFKSVQDKKYLVLHDAFQYFEKRYHLNNQGAVQLSAEVKPSIKRVLELRQLIQDRNIQCVFREPQFSDKQLRYIIQDLPVKLGTLDPIGRLNQAQNYPAFLQDLANQFSACLE